jgi:hypothetical protein
VHGVLERDVRVNIPHRPFVGARLAVPAKPREDGHGKPCPYTT